MCPLSLNFARIRDPEKKEIQTKRRRKMYYMVFSYKKIENDNFSRVL